MIVLPFSSATEMASFSRVDHGLQQGARGPEIGHLSGQRLDLGNIAEHGSRADDRGLIRPAGGRGS